MTQTSRERVKSLFDGKSSDGIPFIPWVCSFAARLEQVSLKNMVSDAGILSRSLINTQKLFGYDVITNIFDTSLEAEACGCDVTWPNDNTPPVVASHPLTEGKNIWDLDISDIATKGRIPQVLEATKRIQITSGKDTAVAAVVTGPLTLAGHLKGETFYNDFNSGDEEASELIEETGSICLNLCRAYCELGIDLIVIAEDNLDKIDPEPLRMLSSPLGSILNVVRYYNMKSIFLGRGCSDGHVGPVFDLGADGVVLSGSLDYQMVKDSAMEKGTCFAFTIPALTENPGELSFPSPEKGLFLSTGWELPSATDVHAMHGLMQKIRDYRGS